MIKNANTLDRVILLYSDIGQHYNKNISKVYRYLTNGGGFMGESIITEWTHVVRPGADNCHYRGYMVAGTTILQYVTDCCACLSSAREGTGGLLVNIDANFRAEVHAMDELVIKILVDRIGNTSRTYSFTVNKTIEYANDGTSTAKLLDIPLLVADGTIVLVCK